VTGSPFEAWHDFFVVAGTAGVTLLGLVFVAVSLNTGIIMRSNERHLRVQAVTSFEALLFTAVLSLILLAPVASLRQHAAMLIAFGAAWFVRSITHLRALVGATGGLRRRLILPAAAYAAVAIGGVELLRGGRDVTLLWIAAVVWLVVTATRNAWSLLVDVGEVRVEDARSATRPSE
jgi:hypothetical protein